MVAIVGQTGTGKTELACAVARRCGAEVISADSMQVYRGLDIGTAKPSLELREEIPHHALDLVDPDQPMSAGLWAEYARAAALQIHARGRAILLCGGTGLYARAFAGGLVPGIAADPQLRAELEARPQAELRAELARVDPTGAARIEPGDRVRTVRALEVARLSGRPLSAQHAEHAFGDRPFDVVWLALGLERDALWARLRARVDRMFDAGLVAEVEQLRAAGYGPELRPLRAIGYLQAGAVLEGRLDDPQARHETYLATRRYARRQRTWFKAEPGLRWLDASRTVEAVEEVLRAVSAL